MQTIIILDTSCFSNLSKINELELLKHTFDTNFRLPHNIETLALKQVGEK